ncbi:amino acid ABC transporter permease [Paraburkholderia sediminicola]|uniref:amino acid ABC transporter permease n=1 Tax=Paraburkholderia sediminicola TaxID=458836 RepID=UPI0038B6B9F7
MIDIIRTYWQTLLVGQYPQGPLGGVALTILMAVVCIAVSLPLALVLALCRTSMYRLLRWPAFAVIQFVRGLPLIMFIFWAYFLLPALIHLTVSGVTTLLCALVVYQSAYLAEVLRSGIEAIPHGQIQAARSLGLGYFRTMRFVVIPQALFNVMPSILSEFISTIKETSLGYVVGVQELSFAANQVNNMLMVKPVEVYTLLAGIYFVVCFCLTRAARLVERSVNQRRSGQGPVTTNRFIKLASVQNDQA